MRTRRPPFAILILTTCLAFAGWTGCGGDDPAGPGEMSAEELGTVGARIHAEPQRAESILQEIGMTREAFVERVQEVASDPEAARRYTEAFEGSGGTPPPGSG